MKDISEIDKNLKIETSIEREGLTFFNSLSKPFKLYGIYHDGEKFRRLPDDVAAATNAGVHRLSTNTAGGRLRFITDSPYVAIKVMIPHETKFSHMSLIGIAGFDMYVFEDGRDRLRKSFLPPYSFKDSYELTRAKLSEAKTTLAVMHPLPRVTEINVDVDDDPRCAYFDQAAWGRYIRMALIIKLLSDKSADKVTEAYEENAELICENPHCITGVERGIKHLFKDGKCVYCDQKANKK